jgi:hypothetical protein
MLKPLVPFFVLFYVFAGGCVGHRVGPELDVAVLFSINPNVARSVGGTDTFHGYPILGRLVLAGQEKSELLAAWAKGKADKPQYSAKCFIPRHGLQLTESGVSQEYVICFQCNRIEAYRGGHEFTTGTIDDAPRVVFNRILTKAHIPIVE